MPLFVSSRLSRLIFLVLGILVLGFPAAAHTNGPVTYDMGNPVLTEIYVAPSGNDNASGNSPSEALQTIGAAWRMIPEGELSGTGYRINLLPGEYPCEGDCNNYFENRQGTHDFPILIESTNGPGTVTLLGGLNIAHVRYVYLLDFGMVAGGGKAQWGNNVFHCEDCQYLLLRNLTISGPDGMANPENYDIQETVKINQSQYVYLESNDISGSYQTSVDFVAVQYGHILYNQLHGAKEWCMYLKGGSAYIRAESNTLYNCGLGFQAGEGTSLEYMVAPWFQYEAYDIKFVNNLLHDIPGEGLSVAGGYDILLAYNLLYNVGTYFSADDARGYSLFQVVPGSRNCADAAKCADLVAQGAWGPDTVDETGGEWIPSRNVYFYSNVFYNPTRSTRYNHLDVRGAVDVPAAARNIPNPARSDDNLHIRGNIIWNGGAEMPLGIDAGTGCGDDNPTCNAAQIMAQNSINQFEPQLINPEQGDYRPLEDGNIFSVPAFIIPDFPWEVDAPMGDVSNQIDSLLFAARGALPVGTPVPTVTPAVQGAVIPAQAGVLPPGAVQIITLGDSLTEGAGDEQEKGGYPGRLLDLIDAVRPGSTVLNLGHSGWNSDALINGDQGLPSELEQAKAAVQNARANGQASLVLVWIGSNDLFYLYEYGDPNAADEQADVDHFSANLDTILKALSGAGVQVVMALLDDQSLRPVTQAGLAFPGTSKAEAAMMSEQVKRYNAVIAEMAAVYGALTVDFYQTSIFTDAATLDYDGNHPNAAGYDVIAARWFAVIEPVIGD